MNSLTQQVLVHLQASGNLKTELKESAKQAEATQEAVSGMKPNPQATSGMAQQSKHLQDQRKVLEQLRQQRDYLRTKEGIQGLREQARLQNEINRIRRQEAMQGQDQPTLRDRMSGLSTRAAIGFGAGTGLISSTAGAYNPLGIEQFNYAFRDLMAVIGQAFNPALEQGTRLVRELADEILNMDSSTKKAIADTVVYGVAIAGSVFALGLVVKTLREAVFLLGGAAAIIGKIPGRLKTLAVAGGLGTAYLAKPVIEDLINPGTSDLGVERLMGQFGEKIPELKNRTEEERRFINQYREQYKQDQIRGVQAMDSKKTKEMSAPKRDEQLIQEAMRILDARKNPGSIRRDIQEKIDQQNQEWEIRDRVRKQPPSEKRLEWGEVDTPRRNRDVVGPPITMNEWKKINEEIRRQNPEMIEKIDKENRPGSADWYRAYRELLIRWQPKQFAPEQLDVMPRSPDVEELTQMPRERIESGVGKVVPVDPAQAGTSRSKPTKEAIANLVGESKPGPSDRLSSYGFGAHGGSYMDASGYLKALQLDVLKAPKITEKTLQEKAAEKAADGIGTLVVGLEKITRIVENGIRMASDKPMEIGPIQPSEMSDRAIHKPR